MPKQSNERLDGAIVMCKLANSFSCACPNGFSGDGIANRNGSMLINIPHKL